MPEESALDDRTREFYRDAMRALRDTSVEFLVGGAYAYAVYTGIARHTKDFDLFLRATDVRRALDALAAAGYRSELQFPHWLGKAFHGDAFVDLIYGGGNGIAAVDQLWFDNAVDAEVFGDPVRLIPAEEMIWSKAYVMERERFDGADIAHVLRARSRMLDWARLLDRFASHRRLLLAHLVLFGFIYPDQNASIPADVIASLVADLEERDSQENAGERVCYGTLLSRGQFLVDIGRWGYRDARLEPLGTMRPEDVAYWTAMMGEN